MEHNKNITALVSTISFVAILLSVLSIPAVAGTAPQVAITVLDTTTGNQISKGEVITAGDQFQVTVTTENSIDCSGQFVVTALGTPGGPPEVLVQSLTFGIGPASGGNSVTGGILTSNGTPGHPNRWRVSTTCDGVAGFGISTFFFASAVP